MRDRHAAEDVTQVVLTVLARVLPRALSRIGTAVLLIGGVWPTVVNALAFGRLTRPPEARAAVSLSGASTGNATATSDGSG